MQMYFGDVSLCYSYSLAMALDAYGYDFKAEFLEAIMVMGNGASIVKEDEQHPLVFLIMVCQIFLSLILKNTGLTMRISI